MTRLEALLRLSLMQAEMNTIAEGLGATDARVVHYASNVLNLLRSSAPDSSFSDESAPTDQRRVHLRLA